MIGRRWAIGKAEILKRTVFQVVIWHDQWPTMRRLKVCMESSQYQCHGQRQWVYFPLQMYSQICREILFRQRRRHCYRPRFFLGESNKLLVPFAVVRILA